MKFNYVITKIPYLATLTLLFSLASCGSYEYVGHDNDGIYGSGNRNVEYQTDKDTEVQPTDNGNYYKNYFKEKSIDYENMTENGEVFTDIDSYQGDYNEQIIDTLEYENAYSGWGQNNDDVTINIYNGGFNYWGFRPYYGSYWNYGWGYAGFYNPFFYNSWFYSPYYYGYGHGFGYGYGYYGHPFYYNNNYYGGFNRSNYAYNRGRRGSILNRNVSTMSRRNTTTTRSRSTVPRTNSRVTTPRNSTPRSTTRPITNTTKPRATTPRATTPRTTTPRATTPRSSTPRTYTPRSSSPSRSSGSSMGRSSSSSRSSGSSSSSSRGRRG